MDKIKIKEIVIPGAKDRPGCVVECPDCGKQRIIRLDAYKGQDTTLCRSCNNRRRPVKAVEDKFDAIAYYRSLAGKASYIYSAQVAKSKERGYSAPKYTRQELVDYLINNPIFIKLFNAWEASGFLKGLAPSTDRICDYKAYSFSNIQIVTWNYNNEKHRADVVSGKTAKACAAVDQLDLDDNFIKRFHSQNAAMRALGIDSAHISACCIGKPQHKGNGRYSVPETAGGFKWRFSSKSNTKDETETI